MYPGVHAQSTPDKPAVIMAGSGEIVTYKQLDERSNQLAQLFRDRGLKKGDAIAVYMENNSRYHEVLWAAQRAGLYYTAISYRLTAPEVEYIVGDCGARVFVTSHDQREAAAEMIAGDMLPGVHTRLMINGTIDGFESYEDVVGAMSTEPIADETEGRDMLYSSGTTGRPKGVRVPIPDSPMGTPDGVTVLSQALYGVTPDSVYLSPAPLYHSAPLRFTMAAQRLGATVVVMEHFDPMEYLRLIEKHKITYSQVVPTMFVRMLKLPKEEREKPDTSSLQVVIHAAAPCPIPVKEQMIEWWGPVLFEYYAGTEGNGFVCCNSEEWLAHKGTVGKAILGTVHIVDEDGTEQPTGESGTIYFEGGSEFEYHNDPEKTKGSRNDKGWSTLGDIGYLDEDGYLYLTDRKAFMIISGGVNIYPQEAENVLTMHPKVFDVAVFGVPNDDFGEEVKAVVQPADMADAGPALERELIAFCREHLADVKCPRSVDFEAELPRHPTGKLYKRLLKDRYWTGHETRIV
ncbi:MAG: AMP-binding protein [Actinobacteria bacterium]|nr:AMP-binding protein [Actinomycetota bacterium]MBV9663054.1 AMP-binding protein [Actinomycetota bacterium]MBV9933358.1 AMP-binding protein [Actinomycetota bacterium]